MEASAQWPDRKDAEGATVPQRALAVCRRVRAGDGGQTGWSRLPGRARGGRRHSSGRPRSQGFPEPLLSEPGQPGCQQQGGSRCQSQRSEVRFHKAMVFHLGPPGTGISRDAAKTVAGSAVGRRVIREWRRPTAAKTASAGRLPPARCKGSPRRCRLRRRAGRNYSTTSGEMA